VDERTLCAAELHLAWEQAPLADNRIELDTATDRTGMPRTRLHWTRGEAEWRTASHAVTLLGAQFAKEDIGRVRMAPWLQAWRGFPRDEAQMAGYHHLGGTRMAASPERGVVDADCRVFGVDNLFVGGSSVFATGGHANPTYSIVQLALRLGDHLADRFSRRA
jgi:choline dehydrogenase-like flavoprotein